MTLKFSPFSFAMFVVTYLLLNSCNLNQAYLVGLSDLTKNKKEAIASEKSTFVSGLSDEDLIARANGLAKREKYMLAVKVLEGISNRSLKYEEAQHNLAQYKLNIVSRVKVCKENQPSAAALSKFYSISDGKYIIQVQCYLGAFQPKLEFHLYSETLTFTKDKLIPLVIFEKKGLDIIKIKTNSVQGLARYDLIKKELSLGTKYRSLGDCGTFGKYHFENDEFVLREFDADFTCDGKQSLEKIYP